MIKEAIRLISATTMAVTTITVAVEAGSRFFRYPEINCEHVTWRLAGGDFYRMPPIRRHEMNGEVAFCHLNNQTVVTRGYDSWLVPGVGQTFAVVEGQNGQEYIAISYRVYSERTKRRSSGFDLGCGDLVTRTAIFDSEGFYADIESDDPNSISNINESGFEYYAGYFGCTGTHSHFDKNTGRSYPIHQIASNPQETLVSGSS